MSQTILASWTGDWPEIRVTQAADTGDGVLDEGAFNTIEVNEVFAAINYAQTSIGQSVLYRSLTVPPDDLETIVAKQQALTELQENPALREQCERIVTEAGSDEQGLYQLLFGNFLGMFGTSQENNEVEGYGYEPYIKGSRLLVSLVDNIRSLPELKSSYLKTVCNKITAFSDSRAYSLMQGPVYKAEQTLYCKKDKPKLLPALIFRPRIFKPLFLVAVFITLWLVGELNPIPNAFPEFTFSPVVLLFTIPLALLYIPMIGSYDRDSCIIPLRDEFRQSPDVQQTLDALGQLDELLSFLKYSESYGSAMVLATMLATEQHQIELKAAKNPVLGKANEAYVANDFSLLKEKLVFITGPNSGGKTAFCKTLTQIQLLSQIGCFIPAEAATIAVADHIFYQVPEISHLDDGEGRFGTELKRTKEIFVATTAKSLVVLDELSEGTTFEEKLETSANVLNGFYQKGNSTILITHNHQLVDEFINNKTGVSKQVEFANDAPTYKLVQGISRVSHADRVAKKIGFSKQDIEKLLSEKE